jgi:phosphoribosylformylglycinamidine (FGAM) synthase PurS component
MSFREYSVKLLDAIQAGHIDHGDVIIAMLMNMSEAKVRDMRDGKVTAITAMLQNMSEAKVRDMRDVMITAITAMLQNMTSAEVRDMCENEGWFEDEDEFNC